MAASADSLAARAALSAALTMSELAASLAVSAQNEADLAALSAALAARVAASDEVRVNCLRAMRFSVYLELSDWKFSLRRRTSSCKAPSASLMSGIS